MDQPEPTPTPLPPVPNSLPTPNGPAADLEVMRGYVRAIRIACDDLHGQPFDPRARSQVLEIILQDSQLADAARERLRLPTPARPHPPSFECPPRSPCATGDHPRATITANRNG